MKKHRKDVTPVKTVFLHGLGQTSHSWDQMAEALGPSLDLLCPDLPGLLRSGEVSYPKLYAGVSRYCDALPGPLNVCGLSLGGILALQYAIEHPEHIHALALIGTQYTIPKTLLRIQSLLFHLMPERMFPRDGFDKSAFLHLTNSMLDLNVEASLPRLQCPVLVVCGERDTPNRRASLELQRRLPHAELRIVEEAGHEVNLDAPRKLAELLRDFF